MPEGDTVWLAGHRLGAALGGHTLIRGELRHPRLSTVDLTAAVVTEVRSVGKHLLIRFADGRTLHTHFRMDGSWHLYRPGRRWRGPDHEVRAVLATAEWVAVGFRLHDMRLVASTAEHRLVGHLGPDLLAADWSSELEAEAVRRLTVQPDRELGLALLDQTVLAGIGNLYRAEVCFLLGTSPWAPVRAVDPVAVVRLARWLLLRNARRPEQSTTGDLRRGAQHWVYQRAGLPCRRCDDLIHSAGQGHELAERTVYWCPTCQPGPHPRPVDERDAAVRPSW